MTTLAELVPDPDIVLQMDASDIAPIVLQLARTRIQNGMFHRDSVTAASSFSTTPQYPRDKQIRVDIRVAEGLEWLRQAFVVVPATGLNGNNGFFVLTERADTLKSDQDFSGLRAAMAFPKSLIHPKIADRVWSFLARSELDMSVFTAFREVEIAVREAGNFGPTDIGVSLMRKAFDKNNGPLTDMNQPEGEREALSNLFAGAIGSYKNPHSHRTVTLRDSRDAQEQVLLASHLLAIVQSRCSQET
jgi:uncharacterized protein (TIGR02391 family)